MDKPQNVYDFIVREENAYQLPVSVIDGYQWSMKEHINTTVLYKNTQYKTGNSDDKPNKNITRPILNLQYRAEGFDVKDIELFVNDVKYYFKSFLVKKFHEKWAREHEIDTFIDEMVECYVDFGGALVKNVNKVKPEVVPLQSICFCDQTDMLSGPIGIKHYYSPDQLKDMAKVGWGEEKNGATMSIDELIVLAENVKQPDKLQGVQNKTPGKYIEVYEVHGTLPEFFLGGDRYTNDDYVSQLQIVSFYRDEKGNKQYVTLFAKKEPELPFKLILRDKVYGRALGYGGAEELFQPQIWVNYDIIRIKGMLDQAAKVLYKTTDAAFSNRNKTGDLENGEILVLEENKDIAQIDNTPRNIALFEKSIAQWEAHAQQMGSAQEAIMGDEPPAGTPFKSVEFQAMENHSLHEYRKGKLSTFLEEIYRDWIIPYLAREITKEQNFIAELDLEELQEVAESLVVCEANKLIMERILNGELIEEQEVEVFKQQVREDFMKGGSKRFIEILEGEMKSAPVDVFVNIAGKQKNLSATVDKLVNIWRFIFSNPAGFQQVMQMPGMAKAFNEIIEYSGFSPIDFGSIGYNQQQQMQQQLTSPQGTLVQLPQQLTPSV